MSASIHHKHFIVSSTEADATVKQDVTSTAAGLSIPAGANALQFTIEKNASTSGAAPVARFYKHGTSPTASVGIPLFDGETRIIYGLSHIKALEFISADSNTQTIYCEWFTTS